MQPSPFSLIEPTVSPAPLIVGSPHSGRHYPDDFQFTCPVALMRQTEDSYVDELVAGAAGAGATLLVAEYPRSYIDLNRAEDDLDPAVLDGPWPEALHPSERTLLGLGLVRRLCRSGVPVYSSPLTVAEVQGRIDSYYRPYHAALAGALAGRQALFGEAYLIDCHSMPGRSTDPRGQEGRNYRQPDFVLGDLNGASCDTAFTRQVCGILQDMGYSVALNDPYKGVEMMRRYGRPQQDQHALQLEINRRLYMNEDTLLKNDGFRPLAEDLTAFFATLAGDLMADLSGRMAAE